MACIVRATMLPALMVLSAPAEEKVGNSKGSMQCRNRIIVGMEEAQRPGEKRSKTKNLNQRAFCQCGGSRSAQNSTIADFFWDPT